MTWGGVAIGFAREGANVVVTDLSERANQETARLVEEAGGKVSAVWLCMETELKTPGKTLKNGSNR